MAGPTDLGFVHGLRTVPRALTLLSELPKVLRLLTIPLVLTAVLDAAAFYLCYDWLHSRLVEALPAAGMWDILRGVLSLLLGVLIVFALAYTFGLVYLNLCELVVDSVSEAVEEKQLGQVLPAPASGSLFRGVARSLLQSVILAGVGVLTLFIGLIPAVGPIVAVLLSITVLGYGFFAISAGRRAKSLAARWALARAHLRAVMGLGVPVFVANFIPLGNLLCLPVFVVAGTLLFLDIEAKGKDEMDRLSIGSSQPS
ncbi:MAG: EI24 domain-containing protein [Myxococcales bacterium]|jgi:uncharacterized protein involved in cysteine biosynthesis|nr:EI24 domain-containing protein [Myxococcales bacterium]